MLLKLCEPCCTTPQLRSIVTHVQVGLTSREKIRVHGSFVEATWAGKK